MSVIKNSLQTTNHQIPFCVSARCSENNKPFKEDAGKDSAPFNVERYSFMRIYFNKGVGA